MPVRYLKSQASFRSRGYNAVQHDARMVDQMLKEEFDTIELSEHGVNKPESDIRNNLPKEEKSRISIYNQPLREVNHEYNNQESSFSKPVFYLNHSQSEDSKQSLYSKILFACISRFLAKLNSCCCCSKQPAGFESLDD